MRKDEEGVKQDGGGKCREHGDLPERMRDAGIEEEDRSSRGPRDSE